MANLSQLEVNPPETTTFYYLFDAYGLTSDPQQKSELQEHLKRVIRIRPGQHDLYSIAVVHGILAHDPALFLLYAANLQRKVEIELKRSRKDGVLRPLINDLINYCFHQELPLPDPLRGLLPKYDNYYGWLLQLDTFDYSHFVPDWLFDYYTLYFRRHFRNSSILAAFLLEYLKGHSLHVEVFQFYIDTYVREEE